jgi:large subunit ribosomal protein L22
MSKTFQASHRMARISPYKARPVINLVRGKTAEEALRILQFEPRRAAPMIRKVIQSALSNASSDLEVKLNRLVVADARIDGGPLLSGRARFRPGPMGRAMPIRKRTSHIVIQLSEPAGGVSKEAKPADSKAADTPKETPKGKSPAKAKPKTKAKE